MAIFRKINIDYWEDPKIVDDFTPEDKYFYLYLMTNPHTNQIGCYGLTIRQMEFETGYNKDTILKLIKRFSENLDVILYDENTKEIIIKNWYKYNWSSSPKVLACILKEYKKIKSDTQKAFIDSLLIQYGYSIDTISIQKHNKNKNKNKEKEEDNSETKKFKKPTLEEVQNYISNIGSNVDANRFIDFYTANGWKVGKNPMKDWKATLRGWDRRNKEQFNTHTGGENEYNAFA